MAAARFCGSRRQDVEAKRGFSCVRRTVRRTQRPQCRNFDQFLKILLTILL
jgi:hypothetical protein